MLAIQKQSKYLRKTVRLPDGSLALVVFELVEINGKVTAKAVYGKILEQTVSQEKREVILISGCCEKNLVEPVISPFFSEVKDLFKNLSFVISQPTRAPNFA